MPIDEEKVLRESIITKLTLLIMDRPPKTSVSSLFQEINAKTHHANFIEGGDRGNIISMADKKLDSILSALVKNHVDEVSIKMQRQKNKL